MKSMERKKKGDSRPAKSAYPRLRAQRTAADSAKPRLHDLTQDQIAYGLRPSTAVQLQQIQKITEFNNTLPPKKRPTSSLPMIQACNIGAKDLVKKDHKKKKVDIVTKYNPIGFVEDHIDPKEDEGSKFSMLGKVRSLTIQSAKQRIHTIRKHSGQLINAPPHDEQLLDNVFVSSSKGAEAYSLSLYNRADKYARPLTAPTQNNWFRGMEKLAPVPEEEQEPKDTRLPEFQQKPELQKISRAAIDGYRLEQISEIESIKEKLAKDNCPQSMVTLQRAILMPADCEYEPGKRLYPTPMMGLMVNPFPKKKKKKGKKKKKKSKK